MNIYVPIPYIRIDLLLWQIFVELEYFRIHLLFLGFFRIFVGVFPFANLLIVPSLEGLTESRAKCM
jgi:hypothetical protein